MADAYDVQVALTILAQTALYPNGINFPSIANCDIRIFPGWPIPETLDADLTARKAQVSVYPLMSRATTRFDTSWQTISINPATITLSTNAAVTQVTVGGAVNSNPQTCMITVNGNGYNYAVQPTDTTTLIAENLAQRIPGATYSSNIINIPNAYRISTGIGVTGVSARELAREERVFTLTVWAPTPQVREEIGNAISSLFASFSRIVMPDGYFSQLKFVGSSEHDELQKTKCYRRDIKFLVEYAITESETDYSITNNIVNISPYPYPQLLLLDGSYFILLDGELFGLFGN
jgi:hypothetical protein